MLNYTSQRPRSPTPPAISAGARECSNTLIPVSLLAGMCSPLLLSLYIVPCSLRQLHNIPVWFCLSFSLTGLLFVDMQVVFKQLLKFQLENISNPWESCRKSTMNPSTPFTGIQVLSSVLCVCSVQYVLEDTHQSVYICTQNTSMGMYVCIYRNSMCLYYIFTTSFPQ